MRSDLLELLQRTGPLTAQEAAAGIGVSRTTVLRHLATLGRVGLVERRAVHGSVGRPRLTYDATELAQAHLRSDYERAALGLIDAARDLGGEDLVLRLFDAWRRRDTSDALAKLRADGVADDVLMDRVLAMAARQDARGHATRVVRGPGLRLVQRACPLRSVADAAPAVCMAELRMLADVLGAEVERVSLIAAGERTCTFRIRPRQRDYPGATWRTEQMRPDLGHPGSVAQPPPPPPEWRPELMRAAPRVPPRPRVVPWPAGDAGLERRDRR